MRFGTGKNVLDCPLHVRVAGVAQMTKGGRQIARADENTVDTYGRGNGVDVIDPLLALDLNRMVMFLLDWAK